MKGRLSTLAGIINYQIKLGIQIYIGAMGGGGERRIPARQSGDVPEIGAPRLVAVTKHLVNLVFAEVTECCRIGDDKFPGQKTQASF